MEIKDLKKKKIKYPYLTKPVELYTLENGHRIILANKKGGLANISTWIKTGSINETVENNGVSHFLEHLMFKGTNKHKAGYFDKTLESYGAIVNAATWKDYTFYYVTLPMGINGEYFNEAIELHADMMLNPILPEDEIGDSFVFGKEEPKLKKERLVVIEEIRMREDIPSAVVYNNLNKIMYNSHPYKYDVIGTPEMIASISREKILDYYKTHYTPNNMITIAVGDFDNKQILEKIIKEFDFKKRKNYILPEYQDEKIHAKEQYIEEKTNTNTGFLMFGFLGEKAKELKTCVALDIISTILGDGISSRFYQNLIEKSKEHIFNQISTEYYNFRDGGNLFIEANIIPKKKDIAIKLIKNEIQNIINKKITTKELNKAKKKLKVSFASTSETVSDIADNIGYYMTVLNDLNIVDKYIDIVENITLKDIQQTAVNYLNLDKLSISVLLPE